MSIVLPAFAFLVAGMFVATMLAAVRADLSEGEGIRAPR